MKRIFLGAISLYQLILSPWVGGSCRFSPTCSDYAKTSLERHGMLKGSALTLRRICACHPYSKRPAIDPVPDQFDLKHLIGYTVRSTNEKKK